MRYNFLVIFSIIFPLFSVFAQDADSVFDDNTAFYEGETYNYIIAPPRGFVMNSVEATDDGFSFAFIPVDEEYFGASITIGINIFKLKMDSKEEITLEKIISGDTLAIREHYGDSINIEEVKPIKTLTGDILRTMYYNSEKDVIPNVMMSYFDGVGEILIFDLSINEKTPRFIAEKKYLECLNAIKILTKGKIEVG